ncbi:hypothetical protein [Steroidobacter gossypii]|uniref:hypothetical protein n=1 Tax=Steroidobacter gossypii TaxID=2805490 RepID=UPI001E4C18F8|nr:hypothetical protein [Steroidobacter gossypii]
MPTFADEQVIAGNLMVLLEESRIQQTRMVGNDAPRMIGPAWIQENARCVDRIENAGIHAILACHIVEEALASDFQLSGEIAHRRRLHIGSVRRAVVGFERSVQIRLSIVNAVAELRLDALNSGTMQLKHLENLTSLIPRKLVVVKTEQGGFFEAPLGNPAIPPRIAPVADLIPGFGPIARLNGVNQALSDQARCVVG